MRMSSPGPTLIRTGRPLDIGDGSSICLSDGRRRGAIRMDRTDRGGDRHRGKHERADRGGGDTSEAIEAEHFQIS